MTIDSTWVLGFIMLEKEKKSEETLVTYEEYHKILDILTKKYGLKIDTNIDNYFFKFNGNAFELNKENDIKASDFINAFKFIKLDKLLKVIRNLRRIILDELKTLNSNIEYTSLEYVIKRIVPDEKTFYIDAAFSLTEGEYKHIIKSIKGKSCFNCTNDNCIKNFLNEKSNCCVFWDNPELVGREKVLSKF